MKPERLRAVPELPDPWPIYAGDDEALEVTLKDQDCNPIDLSEYVIQAAWRCEPLAAESVPLEIDTSKANEGVLTVYISGEQSAVDGGTVRCGVFDIQTKKDGVTRTILRGDVNWQGDVER